MTRCLEQWRQLTASQSAQEEEERAGAFAECVRANKGIYSVALKDATSGNELPIEQLAQHVGPVEVSLTMQLGGKQETLTWKARSPEGVYPLLAE